MLSEFDSDPLFKTQIAKVRHLGNQYIFKTTPSLQAYFLNTRKRLHPFGNFLIDFMVVRAWMDVAQLARFMRRIRTG